jgi:uncharacterized protein DUF2628
VGRSIILRRGTKKQRIPVGFCWGAFVFGVGWAIYRRLWLVALAMFSVGIVLWFVTEMAEAQNSRALAFASLLLLVGNVVTCGIFGNRWRRWTLERRGYVLEA